MLLFFITICGLISAGKYQGFSKVWVEVFVSVYTVFCGVETPFTFQKRVTCLFLFNVIWNSSACRWRPLDERCYYFSTSTLPWDEARTDCDTKGARLMSITTVRERVRCTINSEIYWIGLNDIAEEGKWEWVDGSTYDHYLENWRSGQPDNWDNNEDCGQVGGANGQWNDENCGVRRRYICKHDNRMF
uniref:C-type lectin domain-containing protein n=1 Tax=Denticeps clupeoides TaxID=299321 RepID=A0AAY4ESS0_9TELE